MRIHRVITGLWLLTLLGSLVAPLAAQNKPSTPPDPIKYIGRFDSIWNTELSVLNEMGLKIETVDRGNGRIISKPYEFITGSLSGSELAKIAHLPEVHANAVWVRGRYTVEVVTEIIQGNENKVTVLVSPQGLKRDLAGKEDWVDWASNGSIERRILGRLSVKLHSPNKGDDKKGFWDQPAQSIPRPNESPRLSTPERRP